MRCSARSPAAAASAAEDASTRGVKRKMSNFNVRHRGEKLHQRHLPTPALRI
jgi:hypothetical protein